VATLSAVGTGAAAAPEVLGAGSARRGWFIAAGLILSLAALPLFGMWLLVRRDPLAAVAKAT
jgi:hypothetical protein